MSHSGPAKNTYRTFLNGYAKFAGSERAKMFDAKVRFGRRLNLKDPTTLADKVSWMELYGNQLLMAQLTDKCEVRSFIAERGLADTLVPIVGGPWFDASQIEFSALPGKFALKATHGCEMNLICKDKVKLDIRAARATAAKWLREDYSRACVEPHYRLIPHRVYAEAFVGGMGDTIDYKFHCINGKPEFVLTCSGRWTSRGLRLNLYDLDWGPIDGLTGPLINDYEISRPTLLTEMIDIATRLADGFDFVRVDLYEYENRVYFGEMTFSPASGVFEYFTDEFVERWGNKLEVHA